jgi:hypothetical protein
MQTSLTKLFPILAACAAAAATTATDAHARTWTCNATFSQGNHSYGPVTFGMSGGLLTDREKACRREIQRRWLENSAVFSLFGLSTDEEEAICQAGGNPEVMVDYGFDRRAKEWQFVQSVEAPFCINKALSATVVASSTYCAAPGLNCYSPARANDGDRNITVGGFYSWTNSDTALPAYLDFQLSGEQSIGRAEIYTSDQYAISDFDLEYWDGGQWVNASSVRGNTSAYLSVSFPRVTTAYVRVVGLRGPARQPQYVRINELELY